VEAVEQTLKISEVFALITKNSLNPECQSTRKLAILDTV